MKSANKRKPAEQPTVEEKLLDGTYDRALEAFQAQIDEAAAALRRVYAAMRAENTLRS
jgi:hypothetical protein